MSIKPTYVTFEQAKWIKKYGFDLEVERFYSNNGAINWLFPHREYEHLHSYSEQIEGYFTGKYNWNSLHVDEGMVCLKTAFSECDEWCNCECSAPEQWQIVEWLRVNHNMWISVFYQRHSQAKHYGYMIRQSNGIETRLWGFYSPQDAYSAAFDHIRNNNLI